jgi:hypothetical protein
MAEAAEAFKNLATKGTNAPLATLEDVLCHNDDLKHKLDNLEGQIDVLNHNTNVEIIATTDYMQHQISNLQIQVDELRSEMDVLTEKPKRKVDLEIFDQIFDNSDFPFLESDIFPEIDFNIKI